jgi:23S rRNA pseudouridine2605 synthase
MTAASPPTPTSSSPLRPPRAVEGERLQKVLARAGVGSRREVEGLIAAGRVRVNGERAVLGLRIDTTKDKVDVDGLRVPLRVDLVHFLLNKPAGVVTTAADEAGRPAVVDLIDPALRVWPVGRLDINTEGALIMTNDGDLTHRLTHPSFQVAKTYVAEVRGRVGRSTLAMLRRGVDLDDGISAPSQAVITELGPRSSIVEITVREGRNRLVRRMFDAVGHPVVRLVRTAIGPVTLGRLKPGRFRRLSPAEVRLLYNSSGS